MPIMHSPPAGTMPYVPLNQGAQNTPERAVSPESRTASPARSPRDILRDAKARLAMMEAEYNIMAKLTEEADAAHEALLSLR